MLEQIDQRSQLINWRVLSGRTGSGKTKLLRATWSTQPELVCDLERIANHRGSAFGPQSTPQPDQSTFENSLALDLIRLSATHGQVWIEDESRRIGRLSLPNEIFSRMQSAPLHVIDESVQTRARHILDEYVIEVHASYLNEPLTTDEMAWSKLNAALREPQQRISSRLGGARFKEANSLLDTALRTSPSHPDWHGFLPWIEFLLLEYYDPYYDFHLAKNASRIVWCGPAEEMELQ
jgi:tRNA 2-selenouridine synthase